MYLLAHFLVLFGPGLLLCLGLRVLRLSDAICLSFASSLILITLLLWLSKHFGLTTTQAGLVWCAVTVAALVLAVRRFRDRPFPETVINRALGLESLALFGLIGVSGLYLHIVGPYLEVPADVFAHLEYMQGAKVDLMDGDFTSDFRIAIFSGPGNEIWYYLFAILLKYTSTPYQAGVYQAGLANVLTLLTVIYAFSTIVFQAERNRLLRTLLALFTGLIFLLTFGTNIFAFVRYYALAPTILNLALYFAVTGVLLRYLPGKGLPLFWLNFVAIAMLIAWLIHEQEAIFIFLIGLGIACYAAVAGWHRRIRHSASNITVSPRITESSLEGLRFPWWTLAITGLLGFGAIAFWSHMMLDRFIVTDSKLLSIQTFLPTQRDLYVLNPFRQFYETIALAGVLAYLLAIVFNRWVRKHPYLIIGLLSPLGTVFNPFFADFFLRHSSAESFWRFCYLIPVAFVLSLLLVHCSRAVLSSNRIARTISALAVAVLLIALLLPAKLGTYSTWNRWPTLTSVRPGNGVDQWQDLIDYIATLDVRTRLYTDPVTGYMLTGMTNAQSRRKKFHRFPKNEMSLDYLTPQRMRNTAGSVLIINQRDGEPSVNGGLSRHWPQQITLTSAYYSPELIEYVTSQPAMFAPLWEQDRIRIYRVVAGRANQGRASAALTDAQSTANLR